MKKAIVVIAAILLLGVLGQAWGVTHRYVDSATGDNADNGTTQALAWATLEYALESGSLTADYIVWVRRGHSEIPTSDITVTITYDGTSIAPVKVSGWPRPAIPDTTITAGDWTNGSNIIDNVVGITITRAGHLGRFVTAPDGNQYMITAILWEFAVDGMAGGAEFEVGEALTNTTHTPDSKGKIWAFTDNLDTTGTIQAVLDTTNAGGAWVNNDNVTSSGGGDAELSANATAVGFLIDREYVGATVTGTDGNFQIEADENYADRPTDIDGWDSDAHALPLIDFNGGAYNFVQGNAVNYVYQNIDFQSSSDTNGIFYGASAIRFILKGSLFYQDQNVKAVHLAAFGSNAQMMQCVVEGSRTGTSQVGVTFAAAGPTSIEDTAIYGFGDVGIASGFPISFIKNVNVGVEDVNGDYDLVVSISRAIDLKHGSTGVSLSFPPQENPTAGFFVENYQKVLGAHKSYHGFGTSTKKDVSAGSGDPYKRTGGASAVMDIMANGSSTYFPAIEDWGATILFTHTYTSDGSSKTYRYYAQADALTTSATELWLEAEYVSAYDDTTEYVMSTVRSDEALTQRSGADDWDEYLEVTVDPAVASTVRIFLKINKYDDNGHIYVDPMVVNP